MDDIRIEDENQVSKEIAVLENMNNMLTADTVSVVQSKIDSPSEMIENKLADFVNDAFKATFKDMEFNEALKKDILRRLPTMTDNQAIALFSNHNVNLNDKISKIMGPTLNLMSASKTTSKSNDKSDNNQDNNQNDTLKTATSDLNKDEARDIMQGLNTIYQLMAATSSPTK